MSIAILEKFLPQNTLPFLRKWFASHQIHIKITKNRNTKLGDYCKLPDKTHRITINSTLPPSLFFFVLTHELAHLVAREKFGNRISPHGEEWKNIYREMLLESIEVYEPDLKPHILRYAQSPKANFSASPELVKYFRKNEIPEHLVYIEDILPSTRFMYAAQTFIMIEKRKKNYLCRNIVSQQDYIFGPLIMVEKIG